VRVQLVVKNVAKIPEQRVVVMREKNLHSGRL
jgi:hypothetical protein